MARPCKFGARVRFVLFFYFFLSSAVTRKKNIKGDKDKNNTYNENNFLRSYISSHTRTHAHTQNACYTVMYMKTVAHNGHALKCSENIIREDTSRVHIICL